MPAHIAAINEEHRNIVARATGNSLTFEGRIWAITMDGKKTKLMKQGEDGEEQPVQVFNCVLLGYNPFRGRMYYTGAYDPKKPRIPDCWSDDSVKPNADVPHRMAKTCAECQMSKKGSAVTDDNKQTTACSSFQKLVVIPLAGLGTNSFPPLRLNIKITSIWDKEGEEKHPNWFAFDQYTAALTGNGIYNTSVLPTKIKFDLSANFPKLLFSTGKDFFDEEMSKVTLALAQSDEVKNMLAETFHPTATTGTAELPEDEAQTEGPAPVIVQVGPKAGKAKATPVAAAPVAAPPVEEDDEEAQAAAQLAAIQAKKAAAKAGPAPVVEKAPVVIDDDDEVVLTADQQAAAVRAANAAKAVQTAATATAKAGAAANKKPAVVDPDDEEAALEAQLAAKKAARLAAASTAEVGDPPVAASKKAAAAAGKAGAAPVATTAPANVAALMKDWDA